MDAEKTSALGWLRLPVGIAGAALMVALFLPWAEQGGTSVTAWNLNAGVATLAFATGLVAVAAAATNGTIGLFRPDLSMRAAADLLAVITAVALIAVVLFDLPEGAGAQAGAFLAIAANVVISGCCGDYRVRSRRPRRRARPPCPASPARAESTMIGASVQPRRPSITSTPSMSGRPRSRTTASGRLLRGAPESRAPILGESRPRSRARRRLISERAAESPRSSSTTRTRVIARCTGRRSGKREAGSASSGRRLRCVSATMAPPIASTNPRATERPSPTPSASVVVEALERLEDARPLLVVGQPGPWSTISSLRAVAARTARSPRRGSSLAPWRRRCRAR